MKTGWFLRFKLARSTVSFLGHPMCAQGIVKTWLKTNVENLVKHRSGGYYARLCAAGKERWKSLRTTVLESGKGQAARATTRRHQLGTARETREI